MTAAPLLTFDEYISRNMWMMFAKDDFKAWLIAKGSEMKQSSNTWRKLWNEYKASRK